MIIALSFRLNTLGAYKVRECVINKLTTMPRNGILFLNVRTHECMNKSKYGLNWGYHSYVPFCQFPSYAHLSMGTKIIASERDIQSLLWYFTASADYVRRLRQRYVRTVFEICKFKRRTVFRTIFLSFFESIDPKKLAYFKVAQVKYP